jgi:hypothetical protein
VWSEGVRDTKLTYLLRGKREAETGSETLRGMPAQRV